MANEVERVIDADGEEQYYDLDSGEQLVFQFDSRYSEVRSKETGKKIDKLMQAFAGLAVPPEMVNAIMGLLATESEEIAGFGFTPQPEEEDATIGMFKEEPVAAN